MLAALLALCASAAPVRVAVLPLPDERGAELGDQLAQRLAQAGGGLDVISPGAAAAQLDDERMQRLLGCNGGRQCLTEGSTSLGADWLVAGRPVEAGVAIELREGRTGAVHAAWETRQLTEALVERIAAEVREVVLPQPPAPARRSPLRYLPLVLGGGALAGGVALFIHAVSLHQRLRRGDPAINSIERAESFAAAGRSVEVTAYLLGGLGLALLLGGVAFALLAPESDVTVGLGYGPGPLVQLSGRLP